MDYKTAKELFKKVSVPNSFYHLGDIYEKGRCNKEYGNSSRRS